LDAKGQAAGGPAERQDNYRLACKIELDSEYPGRQDEWNPLAVNFHGGTKLFDGVLASRCGLVGKAATGHNHPPILHEAFHALDGLIAAV
jgi:hypothetical protein